jgi:hypothetical protein
MIAKASFMSSQHTDCMSRAEMGCEQQHQLPDMKRLSGIKFGSYHANRKLDSLFGDLLTTVYLREPTLAEEESVIQNVFVASVLMKMGTTYL